MTRVLTTYMLWARRALHFLSDLRILTRMGYNVLDAGEALES